MGDTVGPAAYVLFDELYTKENVFRSIITNNKTLNIRLLGSAIPCVIVNVKYLTENQKQCFSTQTANERLIQFIGELSVSDDRKRYHLTAFSFTFMDGVSLDLYRTVTKITRSYIAYLPSV
ncbi:unnamed protein product [Schistosoma rodhaini]|uniref:Uncharacterized protein n=1 Tax=Schistosoma rodhaini TaxID=6188 RepID=A0AA85G4Q7_9TREM|nr:unnamed protein product [Schistosoma rodhaini]